ncbi:hypothetical protein [Nostoc sp. DSM 114159]
MQFNSIWDKSLLGCVKRSCLDILTGDLVVYAVTHQIIGLVRYFVNAPYKIRDRTQPNR